MSHNISKVQSALQFAFANRPTVGGFPLLAECLRLAGVRKNIWTLPACQCVYIMDDGAVVSTMPALETTMVDIPAFNESALIAALRADQNGYTTFPEFLKSAWQAGVTSYEVNFNERYVHYYGIDGQNYKEEYAHTEVSFQIQ